MKKQILSAVLLILSLSVFAQEGAYTNYLEGWVDIRVQSGDLFELFIGDFVENGDTIITEADGRVELETPEGALLYIEPGTVFQYLEKTTENGSESSIHLALGKITYKLSGKSDREPVFSTPSAVAGVRGTEFDLIARPDGATLVLVYEGLVEVQNDSSVVELAENTGVEVVPGVLMGEPFEIKRGSVDYENWFDSWFDDFVKNPDQSMVRLERSLQRYFDKHAEALGIWNEAMEERQAVRNEWEGMDEGEAKNKYYQDIVFPMGGITAGRYVNVRYYSLSGLSFRLHVLNGLYARLTALYIEDLSDPVYQDFLKLFDELSLEFEKELAESLVTADF
jgi:hypothetical protein